MWMNSLKLLIRTILLPCVFVTHCLYTTLRYFSETRFHLWIWTSCGLYQGEFFFNSICSTLIKDLWSCIIPKEWSRPPDCAPPLLRSFKNHGGYGSLQQIVMLWEKGCRVQTVINIHRRGGGGGGGRREEVVTQCTMQVQRNTVEERKKANLQFKSQLLLVIQQYVTIVGGLELEE